MTDSRRRALVDHLQALHDQTPSWRTIQEQHFPTVPAGTLCAIAKGEKVPRKHMKALGLTGRRERTEMEKAISKMARATNDAVVRRKK
jgi:hypothetical protein